MSTFQSPLAHRRNNDEGFTLIELMVVVMIIAVLLAIAIPTFLGSQNKAKDRAAQSSLRNALTAAKTIYTDGSDYKLADTVALKAGEPSLTFVTTASGDAKTVSLVATATATTSIFYAAAKSASGTCYFIKDNVTATTGDGTTYSKGSPTACDGATAALPATVYTTSW